MRIRAEAVAAAAALLLAGAAGADEGWKEKLAEAKTQAKASEHLKAAQSFGDALAAVQKSGDLAGEYEIGDAWFDFMEKASRKLRPGKREVSSVEVEARDLKAAVMARLDPARFGALVAAPCLAEELLLEAVHRGDGRFVPEAAAVLEGLGKGARSGSGVKVLAVLARGVRESTAGDEKAAASLGDASAAALRQDWVDLAMAAGVELASVRWRAKDEAKTRGAVAALAKLVKPKTERRFLESCSDALRTRLKEAPPGVLKPFEDAVGPILQKGQPGTASGRGGDAVNSENPLSPLGLALRNPPAGKPLATVSRTDAGFELRVAWDPKYRGTYARREGVDYLDVGGLTVAFADWSVGVARLDSVGNRGTPAGEHEPRVGQAFHRLAPGEVWSLMPDGLVQISAK